MYRSLFVWALEKADLEPIRSTNPPVHPRRFFSPLRWLKIDQVDENVLTRLIYLAVASQVLNLMLATYTTQQLGYQDVLLSVFGNWGLAVFVKLLALGLWLTYREFAEARIVAWLIAPLSLFALVHDILLLA
jgi:hypothetical protein